MELSASDSIDDDDFSYSTCFLLLAGDLNHAHPPQRLDWSGLGVVVCCYRSLFRAFSRSLAGAFLITFPRCCVACCAQTTTRIYNSRREDDHDDDREAAGKETTTKSKTNSHERTNERTKTTATTGPHQIPAPTRTGKKHARPQPCSFFFPSWLGGLSLLCRRRSFFFAVPLSVVASFLPLARHSRI